MIYTGKEFAPIFENMNNIDKKVLRDNKEYYEKSFKDTMYECDTEKVIRLLHNNSGGYNIPIYL